MAAVNLVYDITDAPAAQYHRIALNAPPKGEIKKALVVQLDGSLDGFEYTFYDSAAGCPPGIVDDDTQHDPGAEAQAQVCATRTVANGKDRYLTADGGDGGFTSAGSYVNADGGHSNAQHKLYMKLFVPGGGTKTFGIYLGIEVAKS